MKKAVIAILLSAILMQFTGCLKKKADTESTQVEPDVISEVDTSVEQPDSTSPTYSYQFTPEPNFQREPSDSPFESPYNTDGMVAELRNYAEELGMQSDASLQPEDAALLQLVKSKDTVNGKALLTCCNDEIYNILKRGGNRGNAAKDISFNVTVIKSTEYDCEYDIFLYAEYSHK